MKLQTTTPKEISTVASWDKVKYWAELAGKFQHATVAAQVMCGFELNELKKANNISQGKRTDLQLPDQSGSSAAAKSWPELVKEHAGISDDTARNWMKMADAVKSKWKKLAPQERLRELMAVSPSQWNEEDEKLIAASLKKATDGQTQLEFMRELGLAKKPPGNPNAGNYEHGKKKTLSTAEAAAQLRQFALEHSGAMGKAISISDKDFFLLTDVDDSELDAQIAVLEFALNLRFKWKNTPKAKRNAKDIEAMLADSPLKPTT